MLSPELAEIFAAAGDLSRVVLEVTEQTKVADYGALEAALRPVRAAGALVAVDDTGAGYASLRHVLALSPDFVKLDRSLVANLHREPRRAAAVSAIGALAAELDAAVVAEGSSTAPSSPRSRASMFRSPRAICSVARGRR